MERNIEHSGAWAVALIVIAIASRLLYRYLSPKSWKEWTGAGLIQAFIIALYAEMYGFPLTIYFLVRFFGLDRTYLNANLWATLFGIGELGMMISMIFGYILLFTGLGIFLQGWRELYKAHQKDKLATEGLYSLSRHPQYTGLFLGLFGEGVVHWPSLFSILLFPMIIFAYYKLARSEEEKIIMRFGNEYIEYRKFVPMFIPIKGNWKQFFEHSEQA